MNIRWINSNQFFSFSQVPSWLELNHQKPSVFHTMEQCQCGQKFVSIQLVSHCSWCQQRLEEGLVARFILWLDLLMDNVTHRAVQHNWKHWSCAPETWSWMCLTACSRCQQRLEESLEADPSSGLSQQLPRLCSAVVTTDVVGNFFHFFLRWNC